MNYVIRHLSAGEMLTAHVEARDAASAVALVKANRDQSEVFELLSVLLVTTPTANECSLAAS